MELLRLLRVRSWLKNLFIFAPIFFAGDIFDMDKLMSTGIAFVLFCSTASAVYILNDLIDIEQDKKHLFKKNRPLASGAVSIGQATGLLTFMLMLSLLFGVFFATNILGYVAIYFLLNILYSKTLKHIPIVDILCISSFFFIRVVTGGVAAGVFVSEWLLLCTIFLSLFLVTGKRLAEFEHKDRRPVLKAYSLESLKLLLVVSATLSIAAYSIYALIVLNSPLALASIIFVMLGILRYVFLVHTSQKAEYPEKVVIDDKVVLLSVISWVIIMFYIFYK